MLILTRKVNERIMVGERIEISIVDIKGDQVKIGIDAPKNVKIYRQEVFEAIQEENRAAAMAKVQQLPSLDMLSSGSKSAQESTTVSESKKDKGKSPQNSKNEDKQS